MSINLTNQAGINTRPYARECLRELSHFFEIIVFTASHSCYAEKVIEFLDPGREYIDYWLSRDNCMETPEGVHIKDLRILQNRNLKDVVIVDNAAYSFGFQIDNGIPIIPFYDNKRDMELKYLVDFLKKLLDKDDVRIFLRKTFKLCIYSECNSLEEALERVYSIKQQEPVEEIIDQPLDHHVNTAPDHLENDDDDDDLERDDNDYEDNQGDRNFNNYIHNSNGINDISTIMENNNIENTVINNYVNLHFQFNTNHVSKTDISQANSQAIIDINV